MSTLTTLIRENRIMEQLIGINELSILIGIKRQTIYRWICERYLDFPHLKVGRKVKFRPSEIEKWLDKRNKRQKISNINPGN